MPFRDGTGPDGYGPMTGRAAGFCVGQTAPGNAGPFWGRGLCGRGRGGGRGWLHRYYATGLAGSQRPGGYSPAQGSARPYAAPPVAKQQELDALKGQAEYLEQTLADIRRRLEELQAGERQ